jgi:hypothetical protein
LALILTFSLGFTEFETTVTTLFCMPGFLFALLNFTVISEDFPGAMGSLGHSVAVQPHWTKTFEMIRGCYPEFTNLNVCSTTSPTEISPKSLVISAKEI